MTRAAGIPLVAHFVWFGQSFPWVFGLAVRSAALRGEFERVVLHHADDLLPTAGLQDLAGLPGVELSRFDPDEILGRVAGHASALRETMGRLAAPSAKSDLVRLAILYVEGGVYLDTDTITVASFRPLCEGVAAFCGEERIVYPARVKGSRSPLVHAAAFARARVRWVLRQVPDGWKAFRAIESLYPAALNNAVIGSVPGGAFVTRLIERLLQIPKERQPRPYVIGPHLLQSVREEMPLRDLVVHPPPVFYPLGPEISEHWFREADGPPELSRVLSPETRLVHWYASVRTHELVRRMDPDYVRSRADRQLFSALALPLLQPPA